MAVDLIAQFKYLLPLACRWVEAQEALILQKGNPLSAQLMVNAAKIGIVNPDKVRTFNILTIPIPDDPVLQEACSTSSLVTKKTAGLTLRYGVYIRTDCVSNHPLHVHELVHVAQYERLGSIRAFLQQYLYEVITIGYPDAPMEQEAIIKTRTICVQ